MYVVRVPSHRRSQICNDKTLRMLRREGISKDVVHIYVAEEELEIHRRDLDPELYCEVHAGAKGLVLQREFIEGHWPPGQYIEFLDDDVSSVDLSRRDSVWTHS